MRHLGSLALSIVLAAAIYLLIGMGQGKLQRGQAAEGADWSTLGVGIVMLLVAAACYAALTLTRLSPIGPALAGAVYLVAAIVALNSPESVVKHFDYKVFGVENATVFPLANGFLLFLSVPLIATIASPRRWRGRDRAPAGAVGYPGGSAPPIAASPSANSYPNAGTYPTAGAYPNATSHPNAGAHSDGSPSYAGIPASSTATAPAPSGPSAPSAPPTPSGPPASTAPPATGAQPAGPTPATYPHPAGSPPQPAAYGHPAGYTQPPMTYAPPPEPMHYRQQPAQFGAYGQLPAQARPATPAPARPQPEAANADDRDVEGAEQPGTEVIGRPPSPDD